MQQVLPLWERWETALDQTNEQTCKTSEAVFAQKTAKAATAQSFVALFPTSGLIFTPFSVINPPLLSPSFQDSDQLVITILDENDHRPIFTRTSYRAEITENSAAGSTVFCFEHMCYMHLQHRALCQNTDSAPPLPDFVYIYLFIHTESVS